jgi:hypothetical protein
MVNYESILIVVVSICGGSLKKDSSAGYYYDEFIGVSQYLLSFSVIYVSVVTLESVTLTLMSKVQSSPRQMKKYTIDNTFVVILESAIARCVGDLMIYAFDVSGHDIINCLAFTLMLSFSAGIHVVRIRWSTSNQNSVIVMFLSANKQAKKFLKIFRIIEFPTTLPILPHLPTL